MKNKIFRNQFCLTLQNDNIEKTYVNKINKRILIFTKYIMIIPLLLHTFEFIYLKYNLSSEQHYDWTFLFTIVSIVNLCIIFLFNILSWIYSNIKILKFMIIIVYLITIIPFNTLDHGFKLFSTDCFYSKFLVYTNIIFRSMILLIPLLKFKEILIISIFHYIVSASIKIFFNYSYGIFSVLVIEICLYLTVSYFNHRQIMYLLYCCHIYEDKVNMYVNLIEHLNSAYISLNNTEIKRYNQSMFEIFKFGQELVNNNDIITTGELLFINNYDGIIQFLFSQVIDDYSIHENNNLDIKLYFNRLKYLYLKKNLNNKFLFLGYRDIEVSECTLCNKNYGCKCFRNLENIGLNNNIKKYEIHYRVIDSDSNNPNFELEFIFNDVTNIKNFESKSAELKYKTVYLSKIAHEFKNPLICISEIINNIQISDNELLIQFNNLKYIAEYLLLMIKDLDYFSNLQLNNSITNLDLEEVNINDVNNICEKIANILILRYNKKNLKFKSKIDLNGYYTLISDSIKIKQVLINLISNSIKFSNHGLVSLYITKVENFILFEIQDTGVGLNNLEIDKIKYSKTYFKDKLCNNKYGSGLGFSIINSLLSQLGSKLEIISVEGKGTKFYFKLKVSDIFERIKTDESTLVYKGTYFFNFANYYNNNDEIEIIESDLDDDNYDDICDYIIVADDEILIRNSTIRMLNEEIIYRNINIKIIEVDDGLECIYAAYNLLRSGKSLKGIISDEMMIYMNGTTCAEMFRNIKGISCSNINFYLLTAYNYIDNKYIDGVFSKPFNHGDAIKFLDSLYPEN